MQRYADRSAAGRHLVPLVEAAVGSEKLIVLGLPRGGVPVAFEVAKALDAPLDVIGVRKLGVPGHEELAMGAVAVGGVRVLNESVTRPLRITQATIDAATDREMRVLAQREATWRRGSPPLPLDDRLVVIVDDGLATGSTMRVAVEAVRRARARRIVVAAPVGSREACRDLRQLADEVVCAWQPDPFLAVGLWYLDFSETSDQRVRELLDAAQAWAPPAYSNA